MVNRCFLQYIDRGIRSDHLVLGSGGALNVLFGRDFEDLVPEALHASACGQGLIPTIPDAQFLQKKTSAALEKSRQHVGLTQTTLFPCKVFFDDVGIVAEGIATINSAPKD